MRLWRNELSFIGILFWLKKNYGSYTKRDEENKIMREKLHFFFINLYLESENKVFVL